MYICAPSAPPKSLSRSLAHSLSQALKTTWTKVNRDFSSIFQTLLPNARAKLEPPGALFHSLFTFLTYILYIHAWYIQRPRQARAAGHPSSTVCSLYMYT